MTEAFTQPDVAIISEDAMTAVVAAASFRRAGLSTATYLSGKRKRQLTRANEAGAQYAVFPESSVVKCLASGLEQIGYGNCLTEVKACIDFDDRCSLDKVLAIYETGFSPLERLA